MMTLYISVDLRPSAFSSTSKFKIYAHLNHVSLLAAFGADVSPPPLLCAAVGRQWSVGGSEGICSLSTVYPLLAAWWYFFILPASYIYALMYYIYLPPFHWTTGICHKITCDWTVFQPSQRYDPLPFGFSAAVTYYFMHVQRMSYFPYLPLIGPTNQLTESTIINSLYLIIHVRETN